MINENVMFQTNFVIAKKRERERERERERTRRKSKNIKVKYFQRVFSQRILFPAKKN